MRHIKMMIALTLISSLLLITGCSTNTQKIQAQSTTTQEQADKGSVETNKTVYPLTIKTYDADGNEIEQIFEKAPQRVVTNTQGATELLLDLGLVGNMAGTAAKFNDILPRLQEDYNKVPVIAKGYASKELVLGVSPDAVIGRAELFVDQEWGNGTVQDLNAMGIKTYIQKASLKNSELKDVFYDIEQIGKIFDIQDEAKKYISKLEGDLNNIQQKLSSVKEKQKAVFMVDFNGNAFSIFAGPLLHFQDDAISYIHLEDAASEISTEVGAEQLISLNPDVILYVDYEGSAKSTDEAIKLLYETQSIQTVNAIKNKKVYVITYNELMTYGFRAIEAIEKLAHEIYPDLMK